MKRVGLAALVALLTPAGANACKTAAKPIVVKGCGGLRIPAGAVLDAKRSRGPVAVYAYKKRGFATVAPRVEKLVKADGWKVLKRIDVGHSRVIARLVLLVQRGKTKVTLRVTGRRGRKTCGLFVTRMR